MRQADRCDVGPGGLRVGSVDDCGAPPDRLGLRPRAVHEWRAVRLRLPDGPVEKLAIGYPHPDARSGCPLRPHGISLVRSAWDGELRLYVIQHALEEDGELEGCDLGDDHDLALHSVLIHRLEGSGLVHEQTLLDPLLQSPNDLVALANGQLYVSNDTLNQGYWPSLLELANVSTSSYVVHFAPSQSGWVARKVATGVRGANGVAVTQTRLLVGGFLDEAVFAFARDADTGAVGGQVERIEVGSSVDNMTWSRDDLVVAAHPSVLRFLKHAHASGQDAGQSPSPSEIYRIHFDPTEVERIHANDGDIIGAASNAAIHEGTLFMGQVSGRGIVACRDGSAK